jgi:hypothetical protein
MAQRHDQYTVTSDQGRNLRHRVLTFQLIQVHPDCRDHNDVKLLPSLYRHY